METAVVMVVIAVDTVAIAEDTAVIAVVEIAAVAMEVIADPKVVVEIAGPTVALLPLHPTAVGTTWTRVIPEAVEDTRVIVVVVDTVVIAEADVVEATVRGRVSMNADFMVI
jgi:hypothetical protein